MLNWVFKLTDAEEFGGAAAAAHIHLSCGLKMKPEPVENEWIYIGRFHEQLSSVKITSSEKVTVVDAAVATW